MREGAHPVIRKFGVQLDLRVFRRELRFHQLDLLVGQTSIVPGAHAHGEVMLQRFQRGSFVARKADLEARPEPFDRRRRTRDIQARHTGCSIRACSTQTTAQNLDRFAVFIQLAFVIVDPVILMAADELRSLAGGAEFVNGTIVEFQNGIRAQRAFHDQPLETWIVFRPGVHHVVSQLGLLGGDRSIERPKMRNGQTIGRIRSRCSGSFS